jgi:thiamine-phosphate pyrophosphorylase
LEPARFADELAAALDAAPVACVQIRIKDSNDEALLRACDILRPVAHARDVAVLVNDRPDIAAATGCDGTHIGQSDMPYRKARRLVGKEAIVGVTCHDSMHLAMVAAEQGADYVAFGAFFETATKPRRYAPKPELLSHWQEATTVPCVAIGGITAENCAPLVRAGADFIAVCSFVWDHPEGPAAAVRALATAIKAAAPVP